MNECRGCEAFPKCTAKTYGDTTCRYLRFSYGMDDNTKMTNADRIRAMSDEELSAFLWGFEKEEIARDGEYFLNRNKITEWLKQPAQEVDDG